MESHKIVTVPAWWGAVVPIVSVMVGGAMTLWAAELQASRQAEQERSVFFMDSRKEVFAEFTSIAIKKEIEIERTKQSLALERDFDEALRLSEELLNAHDSIAAGQASVMMIGSAGSQNGALTVTNTFLRCSNAAGEFFSVKFAGGPGEAARPESEYRDAQNALDAECSKIDGAVNEFVSAARVDLGAPDGPLAS